MKQYVIKHDAPNYYLQRGTEFKWSNDLTADVVYDEREVATRLMSLAKDDAACIPNQVRVVQVERVIAPQFREVP